MFCIWKSKHDRISQKTTILSVSKGGLGIPDIKILITALKLYWIRKISNTSHKWKNIILDKCPDIVKISKCGPEFLTKRSNSNIFWTQVFHAYKQFFYSTKCCNEGEILAEAVFFNERIKVGNQVVCREDLIDQNVRKIADFVKENGQLYTYEEFNEKYALNVNVDFSYIGWI